MTEPTRAWLAALRRALLEFYDAHARDLPWRRSKDPYRVWVSEIMLQQTRVDAVVPYYERWLTRFPTLDALADAPLDDVLKAWEGLGYYSRARRLHQGARLVRERHAGRLPDDADVLRALPGVGAYTAGAIASIAFSRREPAVDGNTRRVLCRLLDLAEPSPATIIATARALVAAPRPGDLNQALMELGATTCLPRNPRCAGCPAADLCAARRNGTQEQRPPARPVRPLPHFDLGTAAVLSATGRLLLVRRPDDGLLAGLWELPSSPIPARGEAIEAAIAAARAMLPSVELGAGEDIGNVRHVFTHRVETYHVFRFRIGAQAGGRRSPRVRSAGCAARWADRGVLRALALPAAQRRIAGLALSPGGEDAGSLQGGPRGRTRDGARA